MKRVLIVTDDTELIRRAADRIAAELKGSRVLVRCAGDFTGTDLLPAEVCFFGCEEPEPASFGYLAALLKHINLAGRPCGIFTHQSKRALEYLAALVEDSELALNPRPFFAGGTEELGTWVRDVMAQSS